MGLGDGHKADQAAVESMRKVMDEVPMDGTIVIGEGERDDAPMLFHRRKKLAPRSMSAVFNFPAVDIAVDPLEGTNLCATGAPGAITVLAASGKKAACFTPPTSIWKKLLWDHQAKAAVDLDAPVADNLRAHRQMPGPRRRGSRHHRIGPAAARKTHRGYSRDRRPHPP